MVVQGEIICDQLSSRARSWCLKQKKGEGAASETRVYKGYLLLSVNMLTPVTDDNVVGWQ